MEKRQTKHLSDLIGKGVEIKEKTLSPKKQDEQFFLKLIDVLCAISERSLMAEDLGINLFAYDLGYMEIIENLLAKTYGEIPSSVILWYVFEKTSEHGEECSIIDENDIEHLIKTPKQLYKFIKQYE
jgi:hypothetical protein